VDLKKTMPVADCFYTVAGKKWNNFIFASNFASAGQLSKFFHQQA